MQYGTPHPHCQLCKRTIQPQDRLTFQDGDLFHAYCFEQHIRHCLKAEQQARALVPEHSEQP